MSYIGPLFSNTKSAVIGASSKDFKSYRRPSPLRIPAFSWDELEHDAKSYRLPTKYFTETLRMEHCLKDELNRIVANEKELIEAHYLKKIQDLLKGFKTRKQEWEELVRNELSEIDTHSEIEKMELQQNFTIKIERMTNKFNNEKSDIEKQHQNLAKEKNMVFEQKSKQLEESLCNQLDSIKKQYEIQQDMKLEAEKQLLVQCHQKEMIQFEKSREHKKDEQQKCFQLERDELERKFNREQADTVVKFHEKTLLMQKNYADEKIRLETDFMARICQLEEKLSKESNIRKEAERSLEREKSHAIAISEMLKDEIESLKDEIIRVRNISRTPTTETVKLIETKQCCPKSPVDIQKQCNTFSTRAKLPSRLREEFDSLLKEYKESLKGKFEQDKMAIEGKAQNEIKRLKESISKEHEELEKSVNEEKYLMERNMDRSRENIEAELERRYRNKQLQATLSQQQVHLDSLLESRSNGENTNLRVEEIKRYEIKKEDVKRENEGLKIKMKALEDSNIILKNLKEEGRKEVERLRKAVEDLKHMMEEKRLRAHVIMDEFNSQMGEKPLPPQLKYLPSPFMNTAITDELSENLRKQEQHIQDKQAMDEIRKEITCKTQEKYESLRSDKIRLESGLSSLENKVSLLQSELKYLQSNQQSQPTKQPPITLQTCPYSPMFSGHPAVFPYPQSAHNIELSTLQKDYKSLEIELQKSKQTSESLQLKLQEYEEQIKNLNESIVKERETVEKVRFLLKEEKDKTHYAKENLNLEIEKMSQYRQEAEEIRTRLIMEIEDLQKKLIYSNKQACLDLKRADTKATVVIKSENSTLHDISEDFFENTKVVEQVRVGQEDSNVEAGNDLFTRQLLDVQSNSIDFDEQKSRSAMVDKQRTHAIENWKLLQQKELLQKLIERLTHIY